MLVDTHCHIHDLDFPLDVEEVIKRAHEAGVNKIICNGTDEASSKLAVDFAECHDGIFSTIGIHPHDVVTNSIDNLFNNYDQDLVSKSKKIVAIGEIGLDYFYNHSPRNKQIESFQKQIEYAIKYDLPIVFHVRDAYDDFWPIIDSFINDGKKIVGELHSFSDSIKNMEEGLKRGLYISVNGMSTFSKNEDQKKMFQSIPLGKMLLETDAPFLTPIPFRGKVNEPMFVRNIAEYHSEKRSVVFEEIANITTKNAHDLFSI